MNSFSQRKAVTGMRQLEEETAKQFAASWENNGNNSLLLWVTFFLKIICRFKFWRVYCLLRWKEYKSNAVLLTHADWFPFICKTVGVTVAWKLQEFQLKLFVSCALHAECTLMPSPMIFSLFLMFSYMFPQHCNCKLPLLQFSRHKCFEIEMLLELRTGKLLFQHTLPIANEPRNLIFSNKLYVLISPNQQVLLFPALTYSEGDFWEVSQTPWEEFK